MAAPGGKYFIQDNLKKVAPHHESWKQLWETKWKQPAMMGVYPFMFGSAKDFEPIVEEMVKKDVKEPYDWNTYPDFFFPKAEELENKAIEAEKAGELEKAEEYYLRSSVVYRIARFPAIRSERQKQAWEKCKEVVKKGLALQGKNNGFSPVHEVLVPHKHRKEGEGEFVPVFHQLPDTASKENPVPLVIIVTGLDGYRTELAVWAEGWRRNNVAIAALEIPGTGDSPADPKDSTSSDRQFSSLLDWVDVQEAIDSKKICAWGFSTGGFYAIRLAYTHADRLAGVVSQGGGVHHLFDPEWLDEVNHLEYPFE